MILRHIVLSLMTLVLLLNGCASKVNFTHTPVQEKDFTKDMKTLKNEVSLK